MVVVLRQQPLDLDRVGPARVKGAMRHNTCFQAEWWDGAWDASALHVLRAVYLKDRKTVKHEEEVWFGWHFR